MAYLNSDITFLGSLGGLSAYRMRGTDKIVVRRKGGATREKIRTSPSFANTRRVNAEFGGRAAATKWLMRMLHRVKPMADYNIAGPLNALLKPVQTLDQVSEFGKRGIKLSANPRILEGFSLNKKNPFNSMLRTPLTCEISKDTLSAEIHVPQLMPGINFYVPQYPWFKIVASLGIVPDLVFTDTGYSPAVVGYDINMFHAAETPWLAAMNGGASTTLSLHCDPVPPDSNFSIIVAVGIAFGAVANDTEIQQVRYAGSAQVIGMA